MAGSYLLSVKALLFLLVCLVGLQYLNLLQVNEKHRLGRSLFTLDWGEPAQAPLLASIDQYLQQGGDDVGSMGTKKPEAARQQFGSLYDVGNATTPTSPTAVTSLPHATTSPATPKPPLCPMIPPDLHGPVKVIVDDDVPASMAALSAALPHLLLGGRYRPPQCTARHRVAVIVPYRDREQHLRTFLYNLHHFLRKQLVDYGIFVIEQFGSGDFNRAMLLNVGAAEALKQDDSYQCFVFHDVDLLPEDDRNLYTCPVQPRHMSVAIDTFSYHLPYDDIFGGVSAMTVAHFRQVNGFSNMYWGWGGEDDDISNRLRQKKLYISRYPANVGRYKMLRHQKKEPNPERFKFLYSGLKRMTKDGYSTLKYKRVDLKKTKLYTWVLADLPHLKP